MKKIIGMRMVKTAVAILFCLCFYLGLKALEYIPGVPEDFAFTWFNPFFAGIAAAYSIHASKSQSLHQAKNRCVASLIGGIIGVCVICLYELFGGQWPNPATVEIEKFNYVIPYLLIPIAALIVIKVGVLLHQEPAIFVSILTLLSVTVSPNTNVPNWEFQFGVNRILSTMIGVLIALGVNLFRLPRRFHNKNLLFCIGIEGILANENDHFKGFVKYKLNNLNYLGVNVTLFTTRTPTTFMRLLEDIKINNPVLCMSGAALYDPYKLTYIDTCPIDEALAKKIRDDFERHNITPFINRITNDVLHTYVERIDNEGEAKYANIKKNAGYNNFTIGKAPDGEVLYFLLIEPDDIAKRIMDEINQSEYGDKVFVQIYDFEDPIMEVKDLKYVKIYNRDVLKLDILHRYLESKNMKAVGITTSPLSNHLLANSFISVTISKASEEVKKNSSIVVKSNSYDDLFKEIHRIYHLNLSKSGK